MKGEIPTTNTLILESIEDQWRLLSNGLINKLATTALITRSENKTVRIKIIMTEVYPPEIMGSDAHCITKTNLEESIRNGLSRINEFVIKLINEKRWIFIGYIDGDTKVPIIIMYYPFINLAVYSLKLSDETIQSFKNLANLN